jgi:hypothetical protein
MRNQLAMEDLYGYQILVEELRARTARLERLVRGLLVAVAVLFSALAVAGAFGGTGRVTEATPQSAVSPHGNYCVSAQGTVYLSSLGPDRPSYREFERLCKSRGGEVLWRP